MRLGRAKPLLAGSLCAALALSSFGPQGLASAAEAVRSRATSSALPEIPQLPGALPGALQAPSVLPVPVAPVAASAAEAAAAPAAQALQTGAAELRQAKGEGARAAALDRLLDGSGRPGPSADAVPEAAFPPGSPVLSAAAATEASRAPPVPRRAAAHRSALFPLALATASSVAAGLLYLAQASLPYHVATAWSPVASGLHGLTGLLGAAFGGAAVLLLAATLLDAAVFTVAMARGRKVTDAEFKSFLQAEAEAGRLDPGLAQVIEVYRPEHRYRGLSFGLATERSIYLRPELAASPTLFRIVLIHELHHFNHHRERGPPEERSLRGAWRHLQAEFGARASEIKGPQALKDLKLSALERSLPQAHLSLRLSQPFDILVLNPRSDELKDEAVYRRLSGGRARVETVVETDPRRVLSAPTNARRYRAVVLDQPFQALPAEGHPDAKRLASALDQLRTLHILATRPSGRTELSAGAEADAAFRDLSRQARELDRSDKKAAAAFEAKIAAYWRQLSEGQFQDLAINQWVSGLYGSLQDKGLAFLPFSPSDPGLAAWQTLIRYWQGEDGGRFQLARVDREDGSHVMILRKTEPRVGFWLRPAEGHHIKKSVGDAGGSEEARKAARAALVEAGLGDHIGRFDELGVEIQDVFGDDVGRQEIYVTMPRRNAGQIRQFVMRRAVDIESSDANFRLHLDNMAELHHVPPVWKLGITGADGTMMGIDTSADSVHQDFRLPDGRSVVEILDIVHEGPEDWIGHGSHTTGIAASLHKTYRGIARGVHVLMAKVFRRDFPGASDGDIMGGGTIGFQRGADVIWMSLGQRGRADSNLADFFSNLTLKKNGKGQFTIIVASAGNAGPFRDTASQPAAGRFVRSVGAAVVTPDDGLWEIPFYNAAGFSRDKRYAIPRVYLFPHGIWDGGDVITDPGDPNVYKRGVISVKSKDKPAAPSDTKDGHTSMSGTSMAAPGDAANQLLIKRALERAGLLTEGSFLADHLPLAADAIAMASQIDLKLPIERQGAGVGDSLAAMKLIFGDDLSSARIWLGGLPGMSWTLPRVDPSRLAWIERYFGVMKLEDQVYQQAELAKSQVRARFEGADDDETPAEGRKAIGDAVYAEMVKSFNAQRKAVLPKLLSSLKDEAWLVRFQAAFTLMNLKAPEAALPLAEAALNDSDARVRQIAFLALAEIPGRAVDVLLQKATSDPRWDVGVYAAYALARHGDRGGVSRLIQEAAASDKYARYTAVDLLGELGLRAEPSDADLLAGKVADAGERENIRHLAAASLFNIAEDAPAAISDKVIENLLAAAGPRDLALTRTIAKFFPEAVKHKPLAERMTKAPLRATIEKFVLDNRSSASKPGALGELVQQLAKLLGISLDSPTKAPDPGGLGVPGVDEEMGPLDLIVEPPPGSDGLEAEDLARFEARLGAKLPLSGTLWLTVPEHNLTWLSSDLRRRGFKVIRSRPLYPMSGAGRPAGESVLDLDPAAETAAPLPAGPLPVVHVKPSSGVSEARVMAALERLYAEAGDTAARPLVVALDVGSAPSQGPGARPLGRLVNRLVLANVGIVVPAGNGGPGENTLASPADAGLPVVVAAAIGKGGLQVYSSRASRERVLISWADLGGDEEGTGAAALRSALALRELAQKMPRVDGWFLALEGLVRQAARPIEGAQAHEVGAGRLDRGQASRLLEAELKDPQAFVREAGALIRDARDRMAPAAPAAAAAAPAPRKGWKEVLRRILTRPLIGLTVAANALPAWWQDPAKTHLAVTVPIYALRRQANDPGIGKFTDLGPYYREVLAKHGVDTVLLLPHFATLDESPYAPVSLYALNEDYVDWSQVEEVREHPELLAKLIAPGQSVDYAALKAREWPVAVSAYQFFEQKQSARTRQFQAFAERNAGWLDPYAEFMALTRLLGKPPTESSPEEELRARKDPRFGLWANVHRYAQWNADPQFNKMVDDIHAAGGHALFDIPMFRGKNSVDAWRNPQYFRDLQTRNPGIENQWVHEDWKDLALWNWTRLKKEDYRFILDPYAHWLGRGLDGARVDALHFAYRFGNGQKASGDEPGDDYVQALASVFQRTEAFPLAEAFEGKGDAAVRLGFVTVYGDWKKFSTHDDPRRGGFMPGMLALAAEPSSGRSGKFLGYTLGDEWNDPFPVKEMRDGRSRCRYRIPLPSDPDYAARARWDARPQLRALRAANEGDVWKEAGSVATVLKLAADTFVKHFNGSVQIWAAAMDWFLEEWGRDTFVSLPGLLLSTGRYAEAKENLRRFARFEKDGLIPNLIPQDRPAEYNTVDGSLWFIHAVKKFVETTGDRDFLQEMAPVMRRIVDSYQKGTGYERYERLNRIYMDSDGLIVSPAQATWMDADPEGLGHPITPRDGKAVEINALWYSALRFLGEDALADKVKRSFNEKFWFETEENRRAWGGSGGALRDVVDPNDEAIRPNMVFAVSHGGDLLSPERQRAVVLAATRDLLTPYGLRSLSPRDSRYHPTHDRDQPPMIKDQAYHQGTVWPWLIGPYVDALAIVRRAQGWSEGRIRDEIAAAMTPLVEFMVRQPEGSLPELFEGGAPIAPLASFSLDDAGGLRAALAGLKTGQKRSGTFSQAWSVGEALRVLVEHAVLNKS